MSTTTTIKDTLAKIETLLGATVGVTKTVAFTPAEFVAYANEQVIKAMSDPPAVSTARLKALHAAVGVFKDNFTDETAESVNVPITWTDTTALKEKQNQRIDAASPPSYADQSAFSQGFVSKMAELKKVVAALTAKAADGTVPEDGEETDMEGKKAKKAEDEDEEAAAKAAEPPAPPKPKPNPFAKKPEGDEDEEKKKAAKASGDLAEDDDVITNAADKKKTAKGEGVPIEKGLDVSPDGTAWPADMADPAFVADPTKVSKALDWGKDRASSR